MKQTIIVIALLVSGLGFSQVIIGDDIGTATDKTSVLLEFANDGDKGIILPYVTTLPSSQEGTLVLDATNPAQTRVKYNNGTDWVDLSGQDGSITDELTAKSQPTVAEIGKAIIGSETSPADGVLVLESTDKAMVLPQVASTDDILNPSAGMMVYINKVGAKRLAVFNGTNWSYWMP